MTLTRCHILVHKGPKLLHWDQQIVEQDLAIDGRERCSPKAMLEEIINCMGDKVCYTGTSHTHKKPSMDMFLITKSFFPWYISKPEVNHIEALVSLICRTRSSPDEMHPIFRIFDTEHWITFVEGMKSLLAVSNMKCLWYTTVKTVKGGGVSLEKNKSLHTKSKHDRKVMLEPSPLNT